MKIAFYLTVFYGVFGYLVAIWGRAALERCKAMRSRDEA